MEKIIKNNWLTILLVILALVTCWLVFIYLPEKEISYVGNIGLIGTVASFYGLIIAYVQILKVASNTRTYELTFNRTINRLRNNDTISVISRAIQQISLIKKFYDLEKIENTRDNFNNLMIDLSILSKIDKLGSDAEKIEKFIEFCTNMETNIMTSNLSVDKGEIRENFLTLSQIQRYLIGLAESFKTPEKNDDYGNG